MPRPAPTRRSSASRIQEAIDRIWTIVDALNGYITENEPWALAKDDAQRARLGTVLYTCAEGLRALAVLLSPVMPVATEKLWIALGAAETLGRAAAISRSARRAGGASSPRARAVNGLAPLFPRVEATRMTRSSAVAILSMSTGRTRASTCESARRRGAASCGSPPHPNRFGVPVYDNHAHLEIADGDEPLTLGEQLDRALAVGVARRGAGGRRHRVEPVVGVRPRHPTPRVLAAVAIHPNEAPAYEAAGELDAAIAVIDELAAQPRVRAIGETGLDFFRTGEDGFAAQFKLVRSAHRAGQEAPHRDADPRPRRPRRRARDPAAGRCARPHGVPLLLGRRAHGPHRRRSRLLPFVRRQRHVQERPEPARCARGHPARAHPGGDGRAVPHADAAPRAAERAVPRPAHRAIHGAPSWTSSSTSSAPSWPRTPLEVYGDF